MEKTSSKCDYECGEPEESTKNGKEEMAAEKSSALIVVGPSYDDKLEQFCCSNSECQLAVKCCFGQLEFEKAKYREECYYMRDPFEPPNFHKAQKEYTIDDFLVVGAKCAICQQQICCDEECSLFYKHTYCLQCVWRERHSFPDELVTQAAKCNGKKKAKE